MAPRWARVWFGATAACVLAGVVIAMITAANKSAGHYAATFHPAGARAANEFAFFTIQSNLLVGLATLLLAVRLDRSSTAFAVLRLSGLVAIIAAGVGFHAVFAPTLHLKGWAAVWNELLHTVVPVMTVVGWLLIGPRRIVSRRVAWLSVIFPVCWLAFTLIRGAIVHWYPYRSSMSHTSVTAAPRSTASRYRSLRSAWRPGRQFWTAGSDARRALPD